MNPIVKHLCEDLTANPSRQGEGVVRSVSLNDMILKDRFHRNIRYLRLSLTRACQMRCVYCRPDRTVSPRDAKQLSADEIETVVRHLVSRHGIDKVRLTGGDPTVRPDLVEIIGRLGRIRGLDDLAMTTNGFTLHRMAEDYAKAGLCRVNISLDSLDPQRFAGITGVDALDRVLQGIDAARRVGLCPIKLNTVVLRDQNDIDLIELVLFAAEKQLPIRFIELMPMGPLADQWQERYVRESVMRQIIDPIVAHWQPQSPGSDPARYCRLILKNGRSVNVGFITPMSCNFCAACNRMRLDARGALYPCLMDDSSGSLMPAIRPQFNPERFDALLIEGLKAKQAEHPDTGVVTMTHIGG